jgi:hypothetical protein
MLRVVIDFEVIITLAEEGLQSVRRLPKVNFLCIISKFSLCSPTLFSL